MGGFLPSTLYARPSRTGEKQQEPSCFLSGFGNTVGSMLLLRSSLPVGRSDFNLANAPHTTSETADPATCACANLAQCDTFIIDDRVTQNFDVAMSQFE